MLAVLGCCPKPPLYPFVPMHEAIARVNENNGKLAASPGGLKGSPLLAIGEVRTRAGDRPQRFDLDGTLRYRQPRDLILQLRHGLGEMVMQAGSNDEQYWLWVRPEIDTLWWGRYASLGRSAAPQAHYADDVTADAMPIRPDHLIEALGLSAISLDTIGVEGPVYRPEPERNVLIYLAYDVIGQAYIVKEYHLDRAAPFLVREIIFRDVAGRVEMQATLRDFAPVQGGVAKAARTVRLDWPIAQSWMELRIQRYAPIEDDLPPPTNPLEDEVSVQRVVNVDPLDLVPFDHAPPDRSPTSAPTSTQAAPSADTQPAGEPH